MHSNMARLVLGIAVAVGVTGCESAEDRKARLASEARVRVSAESARVADAPSTPSTGQWTDAALAKRFVDAGLAPQRIDTAKARAFMGVPVHAFSLGVARVDAYIYADSTARAAAVAKLDPISAAPAGQPSPWGVPRELVIHNNLFAVVVGGTDRQRERIATAIAAGLASP
ncbi:MAG: hypothetical protein FJ202_02820 [Gemmatimonadetes bacterium]|nr:hypothetical protein [Gemmatimonadota bacterium]